MKKISLIIIVILLVIIAVGMYKFNYLANKEGYDVDGNKIQQMEIRNQELNDKLANLESQNLEDLSNQDSNTQEEVSETQVVETNEGVNTIDNSVMMTVNIPLIKWTGENYIVVWKEKEVLRNTAVLNSIYTVLFMDPYLINSNEELIHPLVNAQLSFDSVSINNRIARVNVSGDFIPSGAMSGFYIRKGINAAAFQYDTVDYVEVYLNGNKWDWCDYSQADASESGCDIAPKYWMDSRTFYNSM